MGVGDGMWEGRRCIEIVLEYIKYIYEPLSVSISASFLSIVYYSSSDDFP